MLVMLREEMGLLFYCSALMCVFVCVCVHELILRLIVDNGLSAKYQAL